MNIADRLDPSYFILFTHEEHSTALVDPVISCSIAYELSLRFQYVHISNCFAIHVGQEQKR